VRSDRLAAASVIALLLVSGLSIYLELSVLLSCLFLGVAVANLSPEKRDLGGSALGNLESVIFAAFFTLAGMELEVGHLLSAGLMAAVLIVARFAGKMLSAFVAMRLAGATQSVRRYLGLALIPQAGVAVGLILLVERDPALAPLHEGILAVGLTAVMINELIGSITAHYAIRKSGDAGKDRPRLIDFIHEHHIVTDLEATSMEEAIAKLTDVMIATHGLRVNRDRFLETFLSRERESSTCVGAGLAIPHGILADGDDMIGVMGISRAGLPLETPDDIPVHCMVLLATPSSKRERHLEVIAALARAVGRDPVIQRQLFSAKSPAHAYEILHGEESEDFNYYLTE
jgi:mannitol/fructose-specific phosphotransferase system IIA component (Ntr-type)